MKYILPIAILFITLFITPLAFAGPGHGHSHGVPRAKINDAGAIAAATKGVQAIIAQKHLIDGAVLDADWAKVSDKDKTISEKGNGYYIVKLDNKDSSKALYVLLSDVGAVYDANYTGKFEGLKK
jgi:hypothetical protein